MSDSRKLFVALSGVILLSFIATIASAQNADKDQTAEPSEAAATSGDDAKPEAAASAPAAAPKPAAPKHVALLSGTKPHEGLIQVYQKETSLYGELTAANYSQEYIVLISISRGIGQGMLLGGMSWGFGDDWVWQFRKVDNRVLIIRKNVRFKATKGSRESYALKNAYTDSVLFSLPIMTTGPKGGDLVDLTQVFMSDLPQVSQMLPGFMFSPPKSLWESIKGFKGNLELDIAATYASGGQANIETVADSRGVTLNIHYSISALPKTNGYVPRLADDRVGYFLTVIKDYSKKTDHDRFERYINRWHLEKDDAAVKLSPPKEPIVFWLEKTIPAQYRPAIQAGILEWNKAFEEAGFANAVEVRTQPVDAEWDPEDINYNTFRWITASAGFAMGPSRVNPYTGQILDADIIFDADFLTFWKEEFDTFTPESISAMTGGEPVASDSAILEPGAAMLLRGHDHRQCMLSNGMARQFAFGATALSVHADPKKSAEELDKLLMQGLKEVAMHEVGHTLGLRHNFKASAWRNLKDMNDNSKTNGAMVASVMDYNPSNIVPKGWQQGDYFPTTIGPYDVWAIQYGYTPFSGGTAGEVKELEKIATRSGEPELAYATDEDTSSSDPDPMINRFDFGDDPVEYAKTRAQLVKELVPGLVERMTEDGDDYVQARRAFNIIVSQYAQSMYFASRIVGGLNTNRSHKGDKDGKAPIEVIEPAKQREALKLIEEDFFSDKAFDFPAEIYNYLGPTRWQHWGTTPTSRKDFPLHSFIADWQQRIINQLLSSSNLERIHDTELKVPADQDAFTTAELIQGLTRTVYSEVDTIKGGEYTTRNPAISSLRRNLQRVYFRHLAMLAMGSTASPVDCQTVAFAELGSLEARIAKLLKSKVKLDPYSQAHLQETLSRIQKTREAQLSLFRP